MNEASEAFLKKMRNDIRNNMPFTAQQVAILLREYDSVVAGLRRYGGMIFVRSSASVEAGPEFVELTPAQFDQWFKDERPDVWDWLTDQKLKANPPTITVPVTAGVNVTVPVVEPRDATSTQTIVLPAAPEAEPAADLEAHVETHATDPDSYEQQRIKEQQLKATVEAINKRPPRKSRIPTITITDKPKKKRVSRSKKK